MRRSYGPRRTCIGAETALTECLFSALTRLRVIAAAGSLKWDTYGGRDVIPLWVADMDLKTSPAIIDAVKKRVDHGIFGYSFPTEGAKTAVMDYYKASRQGLFSFKLVRVYRCGHLSKPLFFVQPAGHGVAGVCTFLSARRAMDELLNNEQEDASRS